MATLNSFMQRGRSLWEIGHIVHIGTMLEQLQDNKRPCVPSLLCMTTFANSCCYRRQERTHQLCRGIVSLSTGHHNWRPAGAVLELQHLQCLYALPRRLLLIQLTQQGLQPGAIDGFGLPTGQTPCTPVAEVPTLSVLTSFDLAAL